MHRMLLPILGVLVAAALTALAITAAYNSHHLSLPVPLIGHILALLLPLLGSFQLIFAPWLSQRLVSRFIDPAWLPVLFSLLETALATLAASRLTPDSLRCILETRWQALFHVKNANSLRAIQDRAQCCGLWSTRDRAWPFPDNTHGADACIVRFDRTQSCGEAWTAEARFVLGVWIAIGAYGLVIKAAMVLLRRRRASWTAQYTTYGATRSAERLGSDNHVRYLDEPPRDNATRRSEAVEEIDEVTESEEPV